MAGPKEGSWYQEIYNWELPYVLVQDDFCTVVLECV